MDIRSSRSLLASIQKRAGTKPDGCGVRSDQLAVIERLHLSRGRLGIAPNVVTAEDMSACVCGLTTYDSAWEHVALAALVLKECLAVCPGTDGTANGDIAALSAIAKAVLVDVIIGHHEPRVRGVGSELIGALAAKLGPSCFSDMSPVLFSEASKIFERRDLSREARLGGQSEIALDDTTGWHALESLLCSYRELVAGCGPQLQYLERAPQEQFDLFIRDAAAHMNRHIRQVTFEFIHVVMNQALPGSLRWVNGDRIEMLCHCVSAGLADDFSQVRLPATYAAKYYLISLNDGDRDMYAWPKLLPRVCLNRYYPADGVKSASQEAWAAVTKGSGRALVTQHIAEAFDYYDAMTKNNSHLICEAACWVLGELGSIIDAEAVAPFLQRLLNLLGVCLGDDSWQVRGAACVATGRVIKAHPYATCEVACEKFLPLWVHHLNDYIWALRSDSAAALGVAFRSPAERLSVEATEAAVQYLNENLAAAKKTKTAFSFIPSTSSLYAFLKNKPTESIPTRQAPQTERSISNAQSRQRFGVVELRRRPGSWGCCMDCGSSGSERKRWQASEGGVLLLRELADVFPEKATAFLEIAVDLLSYYENAEYGKLHNTIWQQLPDILRSLGKEHAAKIAPQMLRSFAKPLEGLVIGKGALVPPLPPDSGPTSANRRNAIRVLAEVVGPDELFSICNYNCSEITDNIRATVFSPMEEFDDSL